MDAIEISYRLRRIGKSQAQVAREAGVSDAVVSNVIHGRITAYAVASYIAEQLGLGVDDIWPGRYVYKPRHRPSGKKEGIQ